MEEKLYVITDIRHSGKEGMRGDVRNDRDHPKRIGRTGHFESMSEGQPLRFYYEKDSNGDDLSGKMLLTSYIKTICPLIDGFVIETTNSIYTFKEKK